MIDKKNFLFAFAILLFPLLMKSQEKQSSLTGSSINLGILNKNIDLLAGSMTVTFGKDFEDATVETRYHIRANESGRMIPILFTDDLIYGGQEAMLDGVPMELVFGDSDYYEKEVAKNFRFNLAEDMELWGYYSEYDDGGITKHFRYLPTYFEAEFEEGLEYIITVKIFPKPHIFYNRVINDQYYKLSFRPSEKWNSTKDFIVKIDASEFLSTHKEEIIKVENDVLTSSDPVKSWSLSSLASGSTEVSFTPFVPKNKVWLTNLNPVWPASVITLLLIVLNRWLVKTFRRRNNTVRFNIWVWLGALVIPMIFLILILDYQDIVRPLVSEFANKTGALYVVFFMVMYPILVIAYGFYMYRMDQKIKSES